MGIINVIIALGSYVASSHESWVKIGAYIITNLKLCFLKLCLLTHFVNHIIINSQGNLNDTIMRIKVAIAILRTSFC